MPIRTIAQNGDEAQNTPAPTIDAPTGETSVKSNETPGLDEARSDSWFNNSSEIASAPAKGVSDGAGGLLESPATDSPGSFVSELYKKLSTLYRPGDGQYFALQYPSRVIDQQTFKYPVDEHLSRFQKPTAVNEAEFALTDALYPVASIVGGPNGQSLAKNYGKVLESLVPTFESVEVRKQREKMRAWLMKETTADKAAFTVDTHLAVPGLDSDTAKQLSDATGMVITPASSPGETPIDQATVKGMAVQAINAIRIHDRADPQAMTRMEFSDSLMHAYLEDKKAWELRRDSMIREAMETSSRDAGSTERLTRTLTHLSAIEEAKLASKYADAVVRGHSHTVRGYLGHLDIKSTAETLQDAKDAFRESAMSSLHAAASVYPVAMQPTDWFETLDTGFTPEDLARNPDQLHAAQKGQSKLIDALEEQIADLRGFSRTDPAEAKQAMAAAAEAREIAVAKLSATYTSSIVSAVKSALQAYITPGPTGTAVARASTALQQAPDDDRTKSSLKMTLGEDYKNLDDIAKQLDEVATADADIRSASRALTQLMSDHALSKASNTETKIGGLERQLIAAKEELKALDQDWLIASRTPTVTGNNQEVGKLPPGNGGVRWSEVHIRSRVQNDHTSITGENSSPISDMKSHFWIGSGTSLDGTSSAASQTQATSSTFGIDLAMRTTYVTVDRSDWFDPTILETSGSFMRGVDDAYYSSWCKWDSASSVSDVAKAVRDNDKSQMPDGYLAAFPVRYVLVKDCVIKISSNYTDNKQFKSLFDEQCEGSDGILCFSLGRGSRSPPGSSSWSSTATSDGLVVRIPGPQILGYVMQVTGKDKTRAFQAPSAQDMYLKNADLPENPDPRSSDSAHESASANADNQTLAGTVAPPLRTDAPDLNAPASTWALPTQKMTVRLDDKIPSVGKSAPTSAETGSTKEMSSALLTRGVERSSLPTATRSQPPAHLMDALQTALGDGDVTRWLSRQPAGTKDELWAKLQEAFGKAPS